MSLSDAKKTSGCGKNRATTHGEDAVMLHRSEREETVSG
jgi:hypothetical protein